jgi:hypothetical protein
MYRNFTLTRRRPRVRFDSGGDLFGLAIAPGGNGVLFVDDNGAANTLDLLH